MGVMSITMFLGITVLGRALRVVVSEELHGQKSVLAQIAETVFGQGSILFFVLQGFTALILILAANTAYQDFPRLSAILARDRFMPRQFMNRGDRLVFSNGIVILSVVAGLLVWAFDAELTRLIQLYVVGVFTAFTLSQSGMVRRWRTKGRAENLPGWKRSMVINAIGATATAVVLVIVAVTKFAKGAWIVIAAMPVIIVLMLGVSRHYAQVGRQLRRGRVRADVIPRNTIVLVMTELDAAAAEALGYVRSLRAEAARFLFLPARAVPADVEERWARFAGPGLALEVLEPPEGHPGRAVRDYIRRIPRGEDDFVTVVIPEMIGTRSIGRYLIRPRAATRVKFRLLGEPGVVVMNVPVQVVEGQPVAVDARALIPTHTEAMVFVAGVHDATIRAVTYARSLHANETEAVYFSADPEEIQEIEEEWGRSGAGIPLVIVEAPFRDLTRPVLEEVRRVTSRPDALAVVVLPEFVVKRWWQNLLHNNTALFIKRLLLFEPQVILTSVPYHLD
jgi:hypothetical protein